MSRGTDESHKRRRIHMDCSDSLAYSSSQEGATPLVNPGNVTKSNRDPHRGLYPRPNRKKDMNEGTSHVSPPIHGHGLDECTPNENQLPSDAGTSGSTNDYGVSINQLAMQQNWDGTPSAVLSNDDSPRKSPVKSGFGFVSARSIYDPASQFRDVENSSTLKSPQKMSSPSKLSPQKSSPPLNRWGLKRKRMVGHEQKNKLNSYFSSRKEESSTRTGTVPSAGNHGNTDKSATLNLGQVTPQCASVSNQQPANGTSQGLSLSDCIDLTQDSSSLIKIPSPSQSKSRGKTGANNAFTRLKPQNSKSKSKKGKKVEPKFNRTNSFLYSGPPVQPPKAKTEDSQVADKYGLLGSGADVGLPDDDCDESSTCFAELPLEVVENIFCRVPLMDLCLNLTRVCQDWNDIITDEKFLFWKKTYYRILRGDAEKKKYLLDIMNDNGIHTTELETVLPGLISYMKDFKRVSSHNMSQCLESHPKYTWVKKLFAERLPEALSDESPHPWCAVTALVVLSETVFDVQGILGCLVSPRSQCTATEVLECLYCIASFLLLMKSLVYRNVWTGMHYRLYYALYLFENESSATCEQLKAAFSHTAGQQTILKYGSSTTSVHYTNEQLRICNHNVGPNEILKIVAFAGTGKTTTLIRYTQLRPQLKFLLVVYNKSVKEHCASRFPNNVTCKTSHGLAMSSPVARSFGHKIGNFRVSDIANAVQAIKGENLYVQAKFVIDTIAAFMASADRSIELSHVPMESTNDRGMKEFLSTERRERFAEDARMIWDRATTPRDTDMRLPHDGYLKVFQLSDPVLTGYDVILIDEAQDLTPAVIDLILRQEQPKILVGDPNQQIYSFRGAVNTMDMVTATSMYFLTQSFRFGSSIGFVANCCLELFKGEKKKILVGNKSKGCVSGEQSGQLAIITRSNFTLFSEAVKKCCFNNEKIKVAFAGGVKDFGFDIMQDIYALLLSEEDRLKDGHVITHPLIKKFRNLPDLERFASKTRDNEMMGKIKIVKTYQHQLPSLVKKILSKCVKDAGLADVVFSTAHKAKGLEFSTVRVTDDYVTKFGPADTRVAGAENNASNPSDEYNLLYVAVTRAKKCLQMSPTLMRVLDYSGEKFRYPRLSADLCQDSPTLQCMLTDAQFSPCVLSLQRKSITLGHGQVAEEGLYSPQVVLEDFASLRKLYGALTDEREDGDAKTERTKWDISWEPIWLVMRGFIDELQEDMEF